MTDLERVSVVEVIRAALKRLEARDNGVDDYVARNGLDALDAHLKEDAEREALLEMHTSGTPEAHLALMKLVHKHVTELALYKERYERVEAALTNKVTELTELREQLTACRKNKQEHLNQLTALREAVRAYFIVPHKVNEHRLRKLIEEKP